MVVIIEVLPCHGVLKSRLLLGDSCVKYWGAERQICLSCVLEARETQLIMAISSDNSLERLIRVLCYWVLWLRSHVM